MDGRSRDSHSGRKRKRGGWTSQLQYLEKIVMTELWNHRWAWPFHSPVDPQQFPDYYQIIQIPMDMGTIKRRLTRKTYQSADECISDFNLMFTNCKAYNNKPSEDIIIMCEALEKAFIQKLAGMPSDEVEKRAAPKPQKRRKHPPVAPAPTSPMSAVEVTTAPLSPVVVGTNNAHSLSTTNTTVPATSAHSMTSPKEQAARRISSIVTPPLATAPSETAAAPKPKSHQKPPPAAPAPISAAAAGTNNLHSLSAMNTTVPATSAHLMTSARNPAARSISSIVTPPAATAPSEAAGAARTNAGGIAPSTQPKPLVKHKAAWLKLGQNKKKSLEEKAQKEALDARQNLQQRAEAARKEKDEELKRAREKKQYCGIYVQEKAQKDTLEAQRSQQRAEAVRKEKEEVLKRAREKEQFTLYKQKAQQAAAAAAEQQKQRQARREQDIQERRQLANQFNLNGQMDSTTSFEAWLSRHHQSQY